MSVLDFDSKLLINVMNSACEIAPNSRGIEFGAGSLRYSVKFLLVGSTDFAIFSPTPLKNLLNSLALPRLSVYSFPSEIILLIFGSGLFFPVSSFKTSHVRFGFFLFFSSLSFILFFFLLYGSVCYTGYGTL
jgi:hypothetical protein